MIVVRIRSSASSIVQRYLDRKELGRFFGRKTAPNLLRSLASQIRYFLVDAVTIGLSSGRVEQNVVDIVIIVFSWRWSRCCYKGKAACYCAKKKANVLYLQAETVISYADRCTRKSSLHKSPRVATLVEHFIRTLLSSYGQTRSNLLLQYLLSTGVVAVSFADKVQSWGLAPKCKPAVFKGRGRRAETSWQNSCIYFKYPAINGRPALD